jgi:hypothetical protein
MAVFSAALSEALTAAATAAATPLSGQWQKRRWYPGGSMVCCAGSGGAGQRDSLRLVSSLLGSSDWALPCN